MLFFLVLYLLYYWFYVLKCIYDFKIFPYIHFLSSLYVFELWCFLFHFIYLQKFVIITYCIFDKLDLQIRTWRRRFVIGRIYFYDFFLSSRHKICCSLFYTFDFMCCTMLLSVFVLLTICLLYVYKNIIHLLN